ncbi:MAG: hypothetical protein R3B90_21015 [Planctomycetaceae bacterium]
MESEAGGRVAFARRTISVIQVQQQSMSVAIPGRLLQGLQDMATRTRQLIRVPQQLSQSVVNRRRRTRQQRQQS